MTNDKVTEAEIDAVAEAMAVELTDADVEVIARRAIATLRASDPGRELVEAKAAYHEILYAVAQKYDGETRHQTALRYITEREAGNGDQRAALAQGQSNTKGEGHE